MYKTAPGRSMSASPSPSGAPDDSSDAPPSAPPRRNPRAEGRAMIGIGFTPFETRADAMRRLAIQAETLGLGQVDIAEGWTHDATLLLAEVAMATARIGIGTSVLSTWGRSPATIALAASGLQRLADGRFTLG